MTENTMDVSKYFMMGSQDVPEGQNAEAVLEQAIDAGITASEYREVGEESLLGMDKINLGTELRKICLAHNIPFIIYDETDMLDLLEADAIHMTSEGHDFEELIEKYPRVKIRLTLTDFEKADGSELALVDYVAIGPVFNEAATDGGGVDDVKQIMTTYQLLSVVAYGGINQTNVKQVSKIGVRGISISAAILKTDDSIEDVVRSI